MSKYGKKSVYEIVVEALHELELLRPTPEEIQSYADMKEKEGTEYGVVTYSKHKRGQDYYFLRLHDSWKRKSGGRVHIDVGYVDARALKPSKVFK